VTGHDGDAQDRQEPARGGQRVERSGRERLVRLSIVPVIVTTSRRCRNRELQVADSDRAAVHDPQVRLAQQLDDVAKGYMTVAVNEGEEALSLACRRHEVDGEDASPELEHAAHLARALLAHWPREMMQHYRAQNGVEAGVGEGKCLDDRGLKHHLDPIVLNWWVESAEPLPSGKVNDVFRARLLPVVTGVLGP
jgi:hypothetical protein